MDKTLADYIARTMKRLENEKQPSTEPEKYLVYPEPQSLDSDEKIKPYGQH